MKKQMNRKDILLSVAFLLAGILLLVLQLRGINLSIAGLSIPIVLGVVGAILIILGILVLIKGAGTTNEDTMKKAQSRTRKIVVTAVLAAITIVLGMMPIGGYIPFFGISITILAIPVIIGAILEGPIVGAGIGLIFGLTSIYQAATAPKSPLDPLFVNPLLSVLPRMLIGPVAWLVWSALKKVRVAGLIAAGFLGSYTNTVLVLGVLGLLFGKDSRVTDIFGHNVWGALGKVALVSGAPEAVVAAALVLIIVAAYLQFSIGKKKGSDL